jgi:hypothetical protein
MCLPLLAQKEAESQAAIFYVVLGKVFLPERVDACVFAINTNHDTKAWNWCVRPVPRNAILFPIVETAK